MLAKYEIILERILFVRKMSQKIQAHLTPTNLLPRIRTEQEQVLEDNFQRNRNPNEFDLTIISAEAGLSETDVKVSHTYGLSHKCLEGGGQSQNAHY